LASAPEYAGGASRGIGSRWYARSVSTGRRLVGAVAGLAMVLLASAREADAYVRYHTDTGTSFAWAPACLPLPIVVYPGTFSMMTIEEITRASTGAGAAWSAAANPCTFIELGVTVASGPAPRAGNDGRNSIILRDSNWCRLDATGACDPTIVYDPAALALTSVSASTSSGVIRDADIEVNAFHYTWADLVAHPDLRLGQPFHDLQNALTHEMGHLLGLDHTCYFQGPPPLDNNGAPITDCANASAAVIATTMFPSANPGDIDKRTLEPDDRAAACGIYPVAATPCPPGAACTCPPPDTDAGQDAGGGGPDAMPTDAQSTDASPADAGKTSSGDGCGCDAGGRSPPRSWPALLFLAAALVALVRRPREVPRRASRPR
jgi:MYXO-CTERM domain-containing protein